MSEPAGPAEVSGAVIAGGASRRMGLDKRALPIEGIPMLRRAIAAVGAVAAEVLVACRRDDPPPAKLLDGLAVRLVYDRRLDGGPLAGVEAALAEARFELVLVIAADMPWLEPAVLRLLVEVARSNPDALAVALRTERGPEPLLAVYRRAALPLARDLLDRGRLRLHGLLEVLRPLEIPEENWRAIDPSGASARNVNRPADVGDGPRRGDAADRSPRQ